MKLLIAALILLSSFIPCEPPVPFITVENYDEKVSQKGVVVVEFWASWNSEQSYALESLEDVKAYRVDVDDQYLLVSRFKVNNVPTLYIYKSGVLRHKETSDVTFKRKAHMDLLQEIIEDLNKE